MLSKCLLDVRVPLCSLTVCHYGYPRRICLFNISSRKCEGLVRSHPSLWAKDRGPGGGDETRCPSLRWREPQINSQPLKPQDRSRLLTQRKVITNKGSISIQRVRQMKRNILSCNVCFMSDIYVYVNGCVNLGKIAQATLLYIALENKLWCSMILWYWQSCHCLSWHTGQWYTYLYVYIF